MDYCRICLDPIESAKFSITNTLQIEFLYLTDVELDESPELSQFLCADCFVCLRNSFKFKAICVENQKLLLEKFEKEFKRTLANTNKDKKVSSDVVKKVEKIVFPVPKVQKKRVDLVSAVKDREGKEIPMVFINEVKTEEIKKEIIFEVNDDQKREELIGYYINLALGDPKKEEEQDPELPGPGPGPGSSHPPITIKQEDTDPEQPESDEPEEIQKPMEKQRLVLPKKPRKKPIRKEPEGEPRPLYKDT
jgi:hypothetical protein